MRGTECCCWRRIAEENLTLRSQCFVGNDEEKALNDLSIRFKWLLYTTFTKPLSILLILLPNRNLNEELTDKDKDHECRTKAAKQSLWVAMSIVDGSFSINSILNYPVIKKLQILLLLPIWMEKQEAIKFCWIAKMEPSVHLFLLYDKMTRTRWRLGSK